jgi:hypothetical protein
LFAFFSSLFPEIVSVAVRVAVGVAVGAAVGVASEWPLPPSPPPRHPKTTQNEALDKSERTASFFLRALFSDIFDVLMSSRAPLGSTAAKNHGDQKAR